MKTPRPTAVLRRGFTLLEVLLAVAILVLISATLYRFMETTLRAATFSQKTGEEDSALNGLRRLVAAQLAALPAGQDGTLVGMSLSRGGGGPRRDAIQMVCPAGNAVLSPDARGFYQVTLDLREQGRGSGHYSLGLSREPWTDDDQGDDDDENANPTGASAQKTTDLRPGREPAHLLSGWVKLMDDVTGLEIAYFDARLNSWVDKWTDPRNLPNLVRLRVGMAGRSEPFEFVERVPGGGTQRAVLNPLTTLRGNTNVQLGGQTGTAQARAAGAQNRSAAPLNGGPSAPLPVGVPNQPVPQAPLQPMPIPGNTNPAFSH